ncbi:MAG: hypothetical protein HYY16_19960 [Planctomycetes bacterium]|nr:hypothetical protein [Planctomycetota bacterium]
MRLTGLLVAFLAATAAWAQSQDDFYYPGKRVWATTSGGVMHNKAKVTEVLPNGDVVVDLYPHDRFETVESLFDMGNPMERRTFHPQDLDPANRPRYEVLVPFSGEIQEVGLDGFKNQGRYDNYPRDVFVKDGGQVHKARIVKQVGDIYSETFEVQLIAPDGSAGAVKQMQSSSIFVNGRFSGLWPKARIARQVGPDQFEVEIFGWDGRPGTTNPSTITISKDQLLRNNVPYLAKDGDSVYGVRLDLKHPDVTQAVAKLGAIVDQYEPQIKAAPSAVKAMDLQREMALKLFQEYKTWGIEHPGNLIDEYTWYDPRVGPESDPRVRQLQAIVDKHAPALEKATTDAQRAAVEAALTADLKAEYAKPEYAGKNITWDGKLTPANTGEWYQGRLVSPDPPRGSGGGSISAILKSRSAACYEQAAVWSALASASGAPRLGLFFSPYETVHGEVRVQGAAKGPDGKVMIWNANQDLTASRVGKPAPNRGFEPPSTSGWKFWEVQMQKGRSGLGYSSGLGVGKPFDPARGAVPANFVLVDPQRLNSGANSRGASGGFVRSAVAEVGVFLPAWFLKEGFKAAEAGDAGILKDAFLQMGNWRFWGGVGGFMAVSKTTEAGLMRLSFLRPVKGIARALLPMTFGMAALEMAMGERSFKAIGIDAGAFLASGAIVNFFLPPLAVTGPVGWGYNVFKLGLVLYGGEQLGSWVRDRLLRPAPAQEGVQPKLGKIGEAGPR